MKTIQISSGTSIPMLGLGTWQILSEDIPATITYAVDSAGYRHIDCASIYGNEPTIGETLQGIFTEGKIKREELFITGKLWNTHHQSEKVAQACEQTLRDLQTDYLDLYLIHWGVAFEYGEHPEPVRDGKAITQPVPLMETWQAMEQLVTRGLVKNIGVSNFTCAMVLDLLTYAKIKPAMNQIEIHPYNTQEALVDFCKHHDISVTAYSPLGSSKVAEDKPLTNLVIRGLAKKYLKTPAQILLRWGIQRGLVVIPRSTTPEYLSQNAAIFDFELAEHDMKQISALDKKCRYVNPIDWWGIPYFD